MLCKLILRNVHRSARDYGIYLVTLILSVGMFYGFLSLSSSHYQAALPRSIHLELLERGMQVAIPVLGLLLLFLLSYVNAYLLRAKQKSFAVQTILGMERRTVALLFFGETLLLGSLAILAGIALLAYFYLRYARRANERLRRQADYIGHLYNAVPRGSPSSG